MKQLLQTSALLFLSILITKAQNSNSTISNEAISGIQISVEQDPNHSYYNLYASDPSFEVYASYNTADDFYLAMPLNETDTVDNRYSYHYSDTIFISRASWGEPGYIDTFDHVFLAFRINKDGSFYYGWIEVYGLNAFGCETYVPQLGCIKYQSYYVLEFSKQAVQTTENQQIVAGEGSAKDFLVALKNPQTTTTNFTIYPNPTSNTIAIEGLSNAEEISVIDNKGTEVMKTHSHIIDFTNFSNGLYYIQTGNQSTKVIKQ